MSQSMMSAPNARKIFGTGLRAGLIAAVINVVVWFVANAVDSMKVGLPETIASSLISVILGGVVYLLLTRLTKKVNPIFIVVSVVFTVLSAGGPIAAMSSAPMPGMDLFNTTTMVATELMHVVAAVVAIRAYTQLK
jgi:hypothetical protein